MTKRITSITLLLVFASSALCSFVFGKSFIWNLATHSASYQQVEVLNNFDQGSFAFVISDGHSFPISFPIPFFPGEEYEPEEDKEDSKKKSLQEYYSNGVRLTHHINTARFRTVFALVVVKYHHSPLYILFEVFRL